MTDTTTSTLSMDDIIAAAQAEVAAKKRSVSNAKGQLTKAENNLDKAKKRVETAQVAVDQAQADLDKAETLVATLSGQPSKEPPRRFKRSRRGPSKSEVAKTDTTDSPESAPTSDTSTGRHAWVERMLDWAAAL